jgi:alpha-D-ribose 1-methylphosphonate 5-triphosphate synthase subunit PhnL
MTTASNESRLTKRRCGYDSLEVHGEPLSKRKIRTSYAPMAMTQLQTKLELREQMDDCPPARYSLASFELWTGSIR